MAKSTTDIKRIVKPKRKLGRHKKHSKIKAKKYIGQGR